MPFKQIYQTIDGKIQMVDENGQVFVSSPTPEVIETGSNKVTSAPVAPPNLPMMGIHNLNMEPARDTKVEAPVAFVKMEQLDASSASLSAIPASSQADASGATIKLPSKSHGSSKPPPKKRRSWGQELPEPTTNLPPRKRAKTDAEKEQRRIERVKRNRQAAHNSRERKRQEHESLETENERLKAEKSALQEENARLRRQVAELTGNKIMDSPVIAPAKNEADDTMRRFMLQSPQQSPYIQSEALFTAEQLPLMGTVAQVSSSFTTQPSTNNTPVLSNSSDFTSPATDPLPYTPTLDSLNLGQTRQFARLSRQDDLQCHPLVQGSMKLSILAMVLSAISHSLNLVQPVGTSTACGHHRSLSILALAFINLLSFTAPILVCVSLTPAMTSWEKLSSLTSSLTRAPTALCAKLRQPGKIMPLSSRKSSSSVVTGVLRELCSRSVSVGWG